MRILFIADIVGKIGRKAIQQILPELKAELKPDLVIANAENLAHGSGTTAKTLKEIQEAGADFFTSGNHAFDKPDVAELLNDVDPILIRPANMEDNLAGQGYKVFEVGSRKIMVINLIGQVFVAGEYSNPFKKLDEILDATKDQDLSAIFLDFHAEVTSEKRAMAYHADGRVSVMVGTHTHAPTADAHIMPGGMAYVTDVGMVGAHDSILGRAKDSILLDFINETKTRKDLPEEGLVDVNAVVVDINPDTKKATSIERVDRTVEV